MIGTSAWAPGEPDPALAPLLEAARAAAGDVAASLALAPLAAQTLTEPGSDARAELWRGSAVAAVDLTAARVLEPHLAALAILGQADEAGYEVPPTSGTWGVFAAEGPGTRLEATPAGGALVLDGTKPWCSLGSVLDHALVTAWVSPDRRALVAVDLHDERVAPVDEPWVARGLAQVRSTGLTFASVPGRRVGPDGWYLTRPGFAWGGLGVAACWLGGAAGLGRRMVAAAREREPDQVALMLLGQVDATLTAAAAVLGDAAEAVDAGLVTGQHAWARCVRDRHVVHEACETVLRLAGHALGPGPLTGEEASAALLADLQVYLRQHKAERDAALVGRAVVDGMPVVWG